MTTITLPVKAKDHPHMRPLNMLRDLSKVADLIELCFSNTMDNDGQRYVNDMRKAGGDEGFLRWANHVAETTSMPLMGYVWEENNRIVGNASLIPFRDKGKRIHLIANVATHPDHRRHGIARALTEQVMRQAREKNTTALWLHVRDDKPGAVKLYADLGFHEITRRSAWIANPDSTLPAIDSDIHIVPRHADFWTQQQDWLRRVLPYTLKPLRRGKQYAAVQDRRAMIRPSSGSYPTSAERSGSPSSNIFLRMPSLPCRLTRISAFVYRRAEPTRNSSPRNK